MTKVAIIDDNTVDTSYLASLVNQYASQHSITLSIHTFNSAEAFLFDYEQNKDYDILLLDIEMHGMDGVTLAKRIRVDNESVQIIFISGYMDYIDQGYDVAALHYLIKPVNQDKFFHTLTRAFNRLKNNEKTLHLQINREMIYLPVHTISHIDVLGNYITIHAKTDYQLKMTLSDIEKQLDNRFMRIGRSCIINLTMVNRVTKQEIRLNNNVSIPLPRGYYDKVNKAIIALE